MAAYGTLSPPWVGGLGGGLTQDDLDEALASIHTDFDGGSADLPDGFTGEDFDGNVEEA
jgi:hypothetical protein